MQHIAISESVERVTLLDEEAFRNTISVERNRSERSGRSLILLILTVQREAGDLREAALMLGTTVLATLKTDIDRVGWFETGRTIGLLALDIDPAAAPLVCKRLKEDCSDALTRETGEAVHPELFVEQRIFPEPGSMSPQVGHPMDPYLYPEQSVDSGSARQPQRIKRAMDIVLGVFLLVILLPLFVILAGMVKLSSRGPVFFRQERIGHQMKPFVMYKFRTMYVDADHQVHHDYVSWFITSSNKAKPENGTAVFKLTNDRRITPIGRVLRRTSLDEFPQLWNVLIGDMSLVGPRPALPYEVEQYKPWHRGRVTEAKPGITGLWQVVGRSRTTFDEMVRLDLQYARSMSFWFDVMIILATPGAMISGKGAR